MKNVFMAGCDAAVVKYTPEDNPYPKGSLEARAWEQGYYFGLALENPGIKEERPEPREWR